MQTFPEAVWVTRRSSHGLPAGAEAIEGGVASVALDGWLGDRGAGRDLLVELHQQVAGPLVGPLADPRALLDVVTRALGDGRLIAYRLKVKLSGGPVENAAELGPPSEPGPVEEKTWVGIELVDDQDPQKPVPYAKYRIELPDGSTREGILDDKGRATLRGIDPGECQVSFPELHAPDWKKI